MRIVARRPWPLDLRLAAWSSPFRASRRPSVARACAQAIAPSRRGHIRRAVFCTDSAPGLQTRVYHRASIVRTAVACLRFRISHSCSGCHRAGAVRRAGMCRRWANRSRRLPAARGACRARGAFSPCRTLQGVRQPQSRCGSPAYSSPRPVPYLPRTVAPQYPRQSGISCLS